MFMYFINYTTTATLKNTWLRRILLYYFDSIPIASHQALINCSITCLILGIPKLLGLRSRRFVLHRSHQKVHATKDPNSFVWLWLSPICPGIFLWPARALSHLKWGGEQRGNHCCCLFMFAAQRSTRRCVPPSQWPLGRQCQKADRSWRIDSFRK